MLYAMVAVYGMRRLPAILIPSWIFVMLTFRSALGPAVGVSVYSNVLHHRQEQHVANLTEYADASNVDFLNNYKRTVVGARCRDMAKRKPIGGYSFFQRKNPTASRVGHSEGNDRMDHLSLSRMYVAGAFLALSQR